MSENKKYKDFDVAWAKMVSKAWSDPKFKERLIKEPLKVFQEQGIEFVQGTECKIHENTDRVVHLCLPKKQEDEMSEEQLKKVSGGGRPVCLRCK